MPIDAASALIESWEAKGVYREVLGHRVFVVDAGNRDAPVLCLLHGYPSASIDFHRVLPHLLAHFRVVVHDQLGYGLSAKPASYSYSLLEQGEIALALWRDLGIERAHLIAHDMGTSVATEILARRERLGIDLTLDRVVLSNGSILIELADLRIGQLLLRSRSLGPLFARLANRAFFMRQMQGILAQPVPPEDLEAMWRLILREDGRARLSAITQYLRERVQFRARWVGALSRLDRPTLILWGREDPVARWEIAEALDKLIPGSELQWLSDLGHYPMLEGAKEWSGAVREFLALDRTT